MEDTSLTIAKPKTINYKNILIISLLPIPNFIILFYYIICFKIIIESHEEECESLDKYNICSLTLMLLLNIYIVSQLCVDSPRLFFQRETNSHIYQMFLIFFLGFSILFGSYILKDEDTCQDKNVYILSAGNLIVQSVIFLLLMLYWLYIVCYHDNTRISPVMVMREV